MGLDSRALALSLAATLLFGGLVTSGHAQVPGKQTKEPVYRVSNRVDSRPAAPPVARHPLDPALEIAYNGLKHIRRDIRDYTATMVKRERIDGKLGQQEYVFVKVRNRQAIPGQAPVPFSVYVKFLKPAAMKGRESIWVEGRNNGKLTAHDTGPIRGLVTVNLDPTHWLAMEGNRYPIYDIGFENLAVKLIEKGERDRQYGDVTVDFYKNAKINGRTCTLMKISHPVKKKPFDYHIVHIFIDDELQIPIRYASWSWPTTPGGKPVLEEEYTYLDVKLNVGLTEKDFDKSNKEYAFPSTVYAGL